MDTYSPEQKAALDGWGQTLNGQTVNRNGQSIGGLQPDEWAARLNAAYPGINAKWNDQSGGDEGGYTGSTLSYDTSKLPVGWEKAMTGKDGGVELDGKDTGWRNTDNYKMYSPSLVGHDDMFGSYTGQRNLQETKQPWYRDLGVLGPLAVSAVTMGAGAGLIGGFGGMSNAAAQGLVSGATGSMGASAAGLGGITGSQAMKGFEGATSGFKNGGHFDPYGTALSVGGSALGLPSWAQTAGKIGLGLAQNGMPSMGQLGSAAVGAGLSMSGAPQWSSQLANLGMQQINKKG